MTKKERKEPRNTKHHNAIPLCERSNTALCGNQGSLQPGSPRSHRASHSGIITHSDFFFLWYGRWRDPQIAKFQTDLITTTSRTQTQWGRPPPRRVFKQKHKTPKQQFSLHKSLDSFPHRKQSEVSCSCNMHCAMLVFLHLSRLKKMAAESNRFQKHQKRPASQWWIQSDWIHQHLKTIS